MAQNIKYYLERNKLKSVDVCAALGFKAATFSDWLHAKTYPRIDKIEKMANYFGITKADLVEAHSSIGNFVWVQVPSSAPAQKSWF